MSSRRPNVTQANLERQNEYFVPRDGIDREVITADICRYLGNDALVRPGHYEQPDGRIIQGYFINAYRNLTTAMIQDLKADSAKWEAERRAASRSSGGGSGAQSRNPDYRGSDIHHQRQYYGPSENSQDTMMLDAPYGGQGGPAPRYPGTGAPGYTGAAGLGAQFQPQRDPYAQAGGFAQQPQFQAARPQYTSSPQGGERYTGPPVASATLVPSFDYPAQEPPYVAGGNMYTQAQAERRPANAYPPATRPGYAPQGVPTGYATQNETYYPPVGAGTMATAAHPVDPFNGRGGSSSAAPASSIIARTTPDYPNPAVGNQMQGYAATPDAMQYEETPMTRPSGPAVVAQGQIPSGAAAAGNRRDRERDRDRGDRDRDRDRERERERDRDRDRERVREKDRDRDLDREDRHALERQSHRHRNRG